MTYNSIESTWFSLINVSILSPGIYLNKIWSVRTLYGLFVLCLYNVGLKEKGWMYLFWSVHFANTHRDILGFWLTMSSASYLPPHLDHWKKPQLQNYSWNIIRIMERVNHSISHILPLYLSFPHLSPSQIS